MFWDLGSVCYSESSIHKLARGLQVQACLHNNLCVKATSQAEHHLQVAVYGRETITSVPQTYVAVGGQRGGGGKRGGGGEGG